MDAIRLSPLAGLLILAMGITGVDSVPIPAVQAASGSDAFSLVSGMALGFVFVLGVAFGAWIFKRLVQAGISLSNSIPGAYDDEQLEIEEDARALAELSPNEQELYFQGKDFQRLNPTDTQELSLSHLLLIQEKGVSAWEFKPNLAVVDDVKVDAKTEINFLSSGSELSVQSNLPVPKANEVYYFEAKIYDVADPESTVISIGLATYPYPYFRLPGRQRQSLAYDSNGDRRYNQSFSLDESSGLGIFPKVERGDVIGVGYRSRSGTVFFTRNGKKLSEGGCGGHVKNWHPKLWPTIGANNRCAVHVNFGQAGYVFIEGNVKKWGFAPLEGNGPPPPEYQAFSQDVMLDSSDVDPQDLMERDGDFPPNFWDVADFTEVEDNEDITLRSIEQASMRSAGLEDAPLDPPNYSDGDGSEEDH
ncbi:unnamed protein product [Kuraishia capsulata CBS 1993]|uniref:B30.2/SPRY domain-containing protein n=1 Tax=Kuraishia capsulata CBS 1993 TaxID=1382522 RepID=W6MMY6_9ASCO|nr:uncharacterized protein KUCA_T00003551001 [Kuraishia capsulata CBS 1993]CDK27573.1 unnamed protein product [Kuraishia capsulata CBS 1993]